MATFSSPVCPAFSAPFGSPTSPAFFNTAGLPNKSDALVYTKGATTEIDGDICLVDISGNDRHLEVVSGTWAGGDLVIKAPAGDAAFIAADISNIFYNTGGTPQNVTMSALPWNTDNRVFVGANGLVVYAARLDHAVATKVESKVGTGTPTRAVVFSPIFPKFTEHTIERDSSTLYYVFSKQTNGIYLRRAFDITDSVFSLSYNLLAGYVLDTVNESSNEDVSLNGTSWATYSGQTACFGNTYSRSSAVGDTAVYTTPDDTTKVCLRYYAASNAGVAKVLIDGNPTLADSCDTAQDLVDSGNLPNTILVANGGNLNPSDRVIDMYQYAADKDKTQYIAKNLFPGVHTITLAVTGYKRSISTDCRVYATAFANDGDSGEINNINFYQVATIQDSDDDSVMEYAYSVTISGNTDWVGNGHRNETNVSLGFDVDSSPVSLSSDGDTSTGDEIVVTKNVTFQHSEEAGNIGTGVCSYTFDADGLEIEHTETWSVALNIGGYVAMFPIKEELRNCSGAGFPDDYYADQGDGGLYGEDFTTDLYCWDDNFIARISMLSHYGFIEDRVDNMFNKMYVQVAETTPYSVSPSDSTSLTSRYYATYEPNGGVMVRMAKTTRG